ncbi:MAG: radical SAM protein [Candidatus Omnitrophica bacterium]|nr:radical SAM protein [Candidatus Omnitrophota bacterium]
MATFTRFDPWKNSLCSCPAKYSLSPYTGCDHGCRYCYASSYIVDFERVRPKQDFLKKLGKELKKMPPHSIITLANSSDPYNSLEKRLRLTRQSLTLLKEYPCKIILVTKSSLVERDFDILGAFKDIVICITVTTLNARLSKKIEPNAPHPQQRLHTIGLLSQKIPVVCRFDPLIWPLNTQEIPQIVTAIKENGARQVITSTYKVRPDNFKRMLQTFPRQKTLWERLYLQEGEKHVRYIYLAKKVREELILKVKTEAEKNGLAFSSCREGFSHYNTAACDGSSFLQEGTDDRRLETADDH